MPDINKEDLYVLTKEGLKTLAKEIFAVVQQRIDNKVVGSVASGDTSHAPTADAVYNSIAQINNIKNLVIADGDITKANIAPDTKTLYVVRKTRDAKSAVAYVYLEGIGYIATSTQPESDTSDINAISNEDIIAAVAAADAEVNSGSGTDSGSDSGSDSGTTPTDGDDPVDDDL